MADWNGLPPDTTWQGFHWLNWGGQEVPLMWMPEPGCWNCGLLGFTADTIAASGVRYIEPILKPSERKGRIVPLRQVQ
jgi:hypothetical protein